MSKRVELKRPAVFELEPDGFSIHTFELSMELNKEQYQQMKDRCISSRNGREKANGSIRRKKGGISAFACRKKGIHTITLEHKKSEGQFDSYF